MARKGFNRHNTVVSGVDDAGKQVSLDSWNDDLDKRGMLGFAPTTVNISISSGSLAVTDTWTVVDAEGAPTTDVLDNITTADTATEDIVMLVADTSQVITLTHQAGGAGQVHLLGGIDLILDENVPVLLIRRGTDWYEFGGGGGSQTPWTSDVDADGFDLKDLSNIEFRVTTGAPANATPAIWADADGINLNVPTGDDYLWKKNGATVMSLEPNTDNPFLDLSHGTQLNAMKINFENGGGLTWDGVGNRAIGNTTNGTAFRVEAGDDYEFKIGSSGLTEMLLNIDKLDIDAKYLEIESIAEPAVTAGATIGRVFMDSGNSNHLSIRRNGASVDLESAIAQTPILQNVDYGGFNIFGIDDITTGDITTPTYNFERTTAQANDYVIGQLRWRHPDGLAVQQDYARITGVMVKDNNGTESGKMEFHIMANGIDQQYFTLNSLQNRIDVFRVIDFSNIEGVIRFSNNTKQQINHSSSLGMEYRVAFGRFHTLFIEEDIEYRFGATEADFLLNDLINVNQLFAEQTFVTFTSGAIADGDQVAGNLVSVDETLSTGGDIFGLGVISSNQGSANVYGLGVGIEVNPILQQSGTFDDLDSILEEANDVATELSQGGAGNITAFTLDNDTMTYGDVAKFQELEILLDTPASGAGVKPTFEFSTGVGTWAFFTPLDGTDGFRQSGAILWDDADIPSWAVGTGSEFLIRVTRTQNNIVTVPILDLVQRSAIILYGWDSVGDLSINNLTFSETTGAPLGSLASIHADSTGIILNAPSGDTVQVEINGNAEYFFSNTKFDVLTNTINLALNSQITWNNSSDDRILVTAGGMDIRISGAGDDISFFVDSSTSFRIFKDRVDVNGNDINNIQNLIHDLSTSGTDIDFDEDELQEISISANTVFTGTNYAIGKSKIVKITTDGTLRTLGFPVTWTFVGPKPADQAASKVGILRITSYTGAEAGVVCDYAVEA